MTWNAKDITGQKFGMLTAQKRLPNYQGKGKTYYECICECGNTKIVSYTNLINGHTYSCGCINLKSINQRKDYTGQRFGNLTVTKMLYNYKNNQTYCECLCDCGNTTIAYMGNVLSGKTKSCGCYENLSRYGRKHHEKDLTGMVFGHLTVLSESDKRYSNGGVGWLCACDCGNQVVVRSGNLLQGKARSCGCNKVSKYEEYVCEILDEIGISYAREFKFEDCRNVYPLPFDFYIESLRIAIECQGQQHYEPVEHFGGDERFERTQKNDSIKKDYCDTHDIILIRLPYTMSKIEMKAEIENVLESRNDHSYVSNCTTYANQLCLQS